MTIRCNGEAMTLAPGATIADLLTQLGLHRPGVAVALHLRVVPRGAWASTPLQDGDSVEIIQAVGGG